jgi:hypothetical protein
MIAKYNFGFSWAFFKKDENFQAKATGNLFTLISIMIQGKLGMKK